MILIGANDVTHQVRPATSVRHLAESVQRLRDAGIAVLVGTCPDLGTLKPIFPPLKQVARTWSRRLAAAQTIAVLESGGRTVSLGSILGPEFAAAPAIFFGPDQFHPSVAGYRSLVGVLLPSALAALGLAEEPEYAPARGEGVLPIADAAVQAVKTPGHRAGRHRGRGRRLGVRGLWVELRHRRRQQHRGCAEAPRRRPRTTPARHLTVTGRTTLTRAGVRLVSCR